MFWGSEREARHYLPDPGVADEIGAAAGFGGKCFRVNAEKSKGFVIDYRQAWRLSKARPGDFNAEARRSAEIAEEKQVTELRVRDSRERDLKA